MKLTVEVTQADIDSGESADCHACPVALALVHEAGTRHPLDVEVHQNYAIVRGEWYGLPEQVRVWIANFDCNGPEAVKPIAFAMEEFA